MALQRIVRRYEVWITIGLIVLAILSRVPLRSRVLFHWDSVNFAYAMREFNLADEQPQPPGYLLYVLFCRLVDLLFGDAQTTMVWISVVSSGLAVAALYWLGRAMFGPETGLLASLLLATSPLFWFYGEIALPHSLDTVLVVMGVWFLYETMRRRTRYLYPAMAVMAVAGGVRPQTLVFLGPLMLFALRKVGWKRFLIAGALGMLLCFAWFVPLMALSGGVAGYMEVMGAFAERFQKTTDVLRGAGWWGLQRNLRKLTMYTLYGWSIALVPCVGYAVYRIVRGRWPRNWEKLCFLALWIGPTVVYYALVHMGQPGLVFVFLPALLLLGAVGCLRILEMTRRRHIIGYIAAGLAINVAIFVLMPEYPLGGDRFRLYTVAAIENSDRYYQDRFDVIRTSLAPTSTAIVASSWHHIEYYLPEYTLLPFTVGSKWEVDEGEPIGGFPDITVTPAGLDLQLDPQGRAALVVYDPLLAAFDRSAAPAGELLLMHGGSMVVYSLDGEQPIRLGQRDFGVMEN